MRLIQPGPTGSELCAAKYRRMRPPGWPNWRRRQALCVSERTTSKAGGWRRTRGVHVLDDIAVEWRVVVATKPIE